MALRPDEFYARALVAGDSERRLPLSDVADADAAILADSLVASCGGRRPATGSPPAWAGHPDEAGTLAGR